VVSLEIPAELAAPLGRPLNPVSIVPLPQFRDFCSRRRQSRQTILNRATDIRRYGVLETGMDMRNPGKRSKVFGNFCKVPWYDLKYLPLFGWIKDHLCCDQIYMRQE